MPSTTPDWGPLYTAHQRAMYLVALSILRRQDLARDAVQNAMVSLMEHPPKNVVSWEAIMVDAAKKRALDIAGSAAQRHHGGSLDPKFDPRSADLSPDESIDALDLIDKVRRIEKAMDMLTDREGQVLVRRVLRDEPRRIIAEDLGVTDARVSQIVREVLEKLRDALADEDAA